jgi:hypothetical protein
MRQIYNEVDVTWSSVEKKYPYSRVEWSTRSNGMPLYTLLDENYKKIEVNE